MLLRVRRGPDRELVAPVQDDLSPERLSRVVREERVDGPVLVGLELLDLPLAVDDEPQRDGLHPTGGEAIADLLPEERGHRVADEAVDDAPGLLRVDEVLVDLARFPERLGDRVRRDLVERDAAELGRRDVDDLGDVPRDRLALAVEVAREPDPVGDLRLPLEQPGVLFRVRRDHVLRGERLRVDADLGLRKIPDMAERGFDRVPRPEHPPERLGLGRALDDDQITAATAFRRRLRDIGRRAIERGRRRGERLRRRLPRALACLLGYDHFTSAERKRRPSRRLPAFHGTSGGNRPPALSLTRADVPFLPAPAGRPPPSLLRTGLSPR